MFDLDNCIAFLVSKTAKNLAEILNSQLIKHGVTHSQWIAMYYIDKYGNISQKDLAELMGVKEPTITGLIEKTERLGYVVRNLDQEDKRRKQLSMTERGKRINAELIMIAEDFKNASLSKVSEAHQEILLDTLDKMQVSAQEWLEDCSKI